MINLAGMAEWQTHQTQNLTMATSYGFKSHCRHFTKRSAWIALRQSGRCRFATRRRRRILRSRILSCIRNCIIRIRWWIFIYALSRSFSCSHLFLSGSSSCLSIADINRYFLITNNIAIAITPTRV